METRQGSIWEHFITNRLPEELKDVSLGEVRVKLSEGDGTNKLLSFLNMHIKDGIPRSQRENIWLGITMATYQMNTHGIHGLERSEAANPQMMSMQEYKDLMEKGYSMRSDALMQLQDDAFGMTAWESRVPPSPEGTEKQLQRVKRAQNVCAALIACEGAKVTYCESLLVVAYFLCLGKDQEQEDFVMREPMAFWLLYTLIAATSNGTYREYYGTPEKDRDGMLNHDHTLCVTSGAMGDVQLLEMAVAHRDPELWRKFEAVGFHLSMVFYGAFMRLFATYVPTTTLYRFWDILFAQSTDHTATFPRLHLVDLAYGILKAERAELMLAESTAEVKDTILGALASLYDSTSIVDLTYAASVLWVSGITPDKARIMSLYQYKNDLFREVNDQVRDQNILLYRMCREDTTGRPVKHRQPGDKGCTTKEIWEAIKEMSNELVRDKRYSRKWGMHRPMPVPQVHTDINSCLVGVQKALNISQKKMYPFLIEPEEFTTLKLQKKEIEQFERNCEPQDLTLKDLTKVVKNQVGGWNNSVGELWKVFNSVKDSQPSLTETTVIMADEGTGTLSNARRMAARWGLLGHVEHGVVDSRVSTNEMFVAFLAASKGTIREKASWMFELYALNESLGNIANVNHIQKLSPLSKALGSGDSVVSVAVAPTEDERRSCALRFHIVTENDRTVKEKVLGEVIVPKLSPFLNFSGDLGMSAPVQKFHIWGKPRKAPVDARAAKKDEEKYVGQIEMAISWTPAGTDYTVGQLTIIVKSVHLFSLYCNDLATLNPRIEVYCSGKKIPRWDPRKFVANRTHHSWLTTAGAYGGEIEFLETMQPERLNKNAFRKKRHGADMGWNAKAYDGGGAWEWNQVFGVQISKEDTRMDPRFLDAKGGESKTISMHACRLITSAVLSRSYFNVTNRQAALISDHTFNRNGVVGGILEAVIVPGKPTYKSMAELKEKDKSFKIVTSELIQEYERQVSEFGRYNLFHPDYRMYKCASDPDDKYAVEMPFAKNYFKGTERTLYTRFVRGGDGERCFQPLAIDKDGRVSDELVLEVPNSQWPYMKIVKEEFVSCIMASPILGDSLRRLGGRGEESSKSKMPLKLEVTLADPSAATEDEEFLDFMDVQQTLLFELWDWDAGRTNHDFLGECFLPSLGEFGPTERRVVLPIVKYSEEEGDRGFSRHDDKKILADNIAVTGQLFVSVKWELAVEDEAPPAKGGPAADDIAARAKAEKARHRGKLSLTIEKAKELRPADGGIGKKGKCDAYVIVQIRNDVNGQWRNMTSLNQFMKTKVVKSNRDPVWNDARHDLELYTGAYEAKNPELKPDFFHAARNIFKTHKTVVKETREKNLKLVGGGSGGMKIKFGLSGRDEKNKEGTNHDVEVYLWDSINEFKEKVVKACQQEAQYLKSVGDTKKSQEYGYFKLSQRALVTVFIPPPEVTQLYQQKMHETQEYKDKYRQSQNDPSSWQPLDPARTFGLYSQEHKFGLDSQQYLKVVEPTAHYHVQNSRYAKFLADSRIVEKRDLEEKDRCFGYSAYTHKGDANSREWRSCIASLEAGGAASTGKSSGAKTEPMFNVDYFVKPYTGDRGEFVERKPRNELILAPRAPLVDSPTDERVLAILEHALPFRVQGKTDLEIKEELNKELQLEFAKKANEMSKSSNHTEDESPPPEITVEQVIAHLIREEEKKSKGGGNKGSDSRGK